MDDSLADQQRWYDERRARNERAEDDRDRLIVALRAEVERLVDGLLREAGKRRRAAMARELRKEVAEVECEIQRAGFLISELQQRRANLKYRLMRLEDY